MEISEKSLIERVVKKGDQHAYAHLVRTYQSRIRLSLRQWCGGDEGLADDLAQETFLKAYRALPGFRSDARFSTWLYRIAYNVMVSHYRKRSEVSDEHALEQESTHGMSGQLDARRDIRDAMKQLSTDQQNAIHLCFEMGFTQQEAAEIMNLPLGTVKTNILRGKQKLQALLSSWKEEVSDGGI